MANPPTKRFRTGLSDGPNGEQRIIDSNLPSGTGQRRQFEPGVGTGYGTGQGYGTGASPSIPEADAAPAAPAVVATGVSRVAPVAAAGFRQAVTPEQMRERQLRMAKTGPNKGGTITAGGVTRAFGPTPLASRDPNRPNQGGTMTRDGVTTTVAPSPGAPQQTERANPLTGDGGGAQMEGTTEPINAGDALGLNRRGTNTPQGMDASPSSNIGGTGLYARKFSNPKSAGVYDSYVKKLFPSAPV